MKITNISSSDDDTCSEEYFSDTEEISDIENNTHTDNLSESIKNLQPYQFEPDRPDRSQEENNSEYSSPSEEEESEVEINQKKDRIRIGNKDWCSCGYCKEEDREIDCLCCEEVAAIDETKFQTQNCITLVEEFKVLCLTKTVLENVLVGLHETKGDPLEKIITNHSLRYAAYKQFIWWVYQKLGKGNRRVIPSCVLWIIRNTFPEENGKYVLYSEGEKD